MSTIRLRSGCFGRKWLVEADLPTGPLVTRSLPNSYSARHIRGCYLHMRRQGVNQVLARYAVQSIMGACLSTADFHGLVTA